MIRRVSAGIRRIKGVCITCRGRQDDAPKRNRPADPSVRSSGKWKLLSLASPADRAHIQIVKYVPYLVLMILIMLRLLSHSLNNLGFPLYFSIGMSSLQLFTCNPLRSARTQRLLTTP